MWEQRRRAALASQGFTSADMSERIERERRGREEAADLLLSRVLSAGEPVGYAAAGLFGPESGRYGVVVDLWIEPAARRRGHGRAALAELLACLRSVGADRALVTFDPADPAQSALFRDGEVNSQRMELRLGSPAEEAPSPDGLSWRPMTDSEYPEWLASGGGGAGAGRAGVRASTAGSPFHTRPQHHRAGG
jgi:GNAT superfamily N-acetyltransferase